MTRWIGQQRDDLHHLKEGAGPTVGENNWQWFWPLAAFMNEVDAEAIDVSAKLCKLIESCFLRLPIETMLPVCQERLEIAQVRPILPACLLNLVGPASAYQTFA